MERKRKIVNGHIVMKNPLVFENAHEAIIDIDTWERVQELRKNKRRPTRTGRKH